MKKINIIILFLFLLGCSSSGKLLKEEPQSGKDTNSVFTSWSLYSTGLYYKSINEYNTAIKYFMDAAAFREELHRIYYQIAESFYYLKNYNNAINYCEMAIKAQKDYTNPYLLLRDIYLLQNKNKNAADILESLIAIRPEMIDIHYSLGILFYKLKDYDKAIVSFRNILEISDAVTEENYYKENANYYLARIYYSKNQIDKSIIHLKDSIDMNPGNKAAAYFLANLLMEAYMLDEAKIYLIHYLARFGYDQIIYANLGRIYYLEGDPKALRYLRSVSSIKGIFGDISKALYFELLNRDKEAEILLKKITADNPMLISPHIALGKIALKKDDKKTAVSEFFTAGLMAYKLMQYETARAQFAKVLAIDDKIPEVYLYLSRIYEETEKTNLAIIYLKKYNADRSDVDIQIHIGYLYSLTNDYKNADKYIDSAIKQDPENPKSYFFKGFTLYKNNDYIEAEKQFRKAIELKNDDDTYYFYLATVQEKQNKLDDTIISLKKAMEYNPENAMVYNYLGYLYAEMNINLDESIELIKKALSISPLNGAYLDSLGWAYYKKGNLKTALQKLLQAEKQLEKENTPDPVVFDHIGDAYNKIGDPDMAVKYWQKAVGIKKDIKIENKIREILEKKD